MTIHNIVSLWEDSSSTLGIGSGNEVDTFKRQYSSCIGRSSLVGGVGVKRNKWNHEQIYIQLSSNNIAWWCCQQRKSNSPLLQGKIHKICQSNKHKPKQQLSHRTKYHHLYPPYPVLDNISKSCPNAVTMRYVHGCLHRWSCFPWVWNWFVLFRDPQWLHRPKTAQQLEAIHISLKMVKHGLLANNDTIKCIKITKPGIWFYS